MNSNKSVLESLQDTFSFGPTASPVASPVASSVASPVASSPSNFFSLASFGMSPSSNAKPSLASQPLAPQPLEPQPLASQPLAPQPFLTKLSNLPKSVSVNVLPNSLMLSKPSSSWGWVKWILGFVLFLLILFVGIVVFIRPPLPAFLQSWISSFNNKITTAKDNVCLLYTSPSPRD